MDNPTPVPTGYMMDGRGRLIPEAMVNEIDLLRNNLVNDIVGGAQALATRMSAFKERIMGDIEAFTELSAERFNITLGGKKGNITLTSFDGRFQVVRAISENIEFDERLQVAKELIDQCIVEWSEGSKDEIKVLVNDAFYVDKKGKLNSTRILGLRRLKIDHPKWKQAMDAISESLFVSGSRSYIRIYERQKDGRYRQLPMDLAAA